MPPTNDPKNDPKEEGVINEYWADPKNDPNKRSVASAKDEKRKEEEHAEAMKNKGYEPEESSTGARGTAGSADADTADVSPLSDSNVDEAIDQISRMRSRDRLQQIAASDKRRRVQEAARARLESMQE